MHEIKEKAKKLCEMKDKIYDWTKTKLEDDCINIEQAGQLVDMIKDLCDAEKNVYKAAYYCTATEELKEEEDEEALDEYLKMMGIEGGRMGYDHWRTSSGRYAPKGTGHWTPIHGRRGYTPYYPDPNMMVDGWWDGDKFQSGMMGYDNRGGGNRSQGGPNSSSAVSNRAASGNRMGYSDPDMEHYFHDERHGRPYREWQLARKHYTETKSDGDKHEMTEHAKEHMADTVMTMKEIWMDATPELKTKMKADLTALMAEMK